MKFTATFAVASALLSCVAAFTGYPLHNSAEPGSVYPFIGLGTGGYGLDPFRVYPECWISKVPGCAKTGKEAVMNWLQAGGVRIDNANSYYNEPSMAEGIKASGVSRDKIFITSKVGPSYPLGYNDTLNQFASILENLQTTYVDLLLIHWPTYAPSILSPVQSSDPLCNHNSPQFNATGCRLSTWRAMVKIFQSKGARAIGVSNYYPAELDEIKNAGLPLPSVNQCPFNPHRSSTQAAVRQWCKENSVLFNAYSPLGIPDITVDVPKVESVLLHRYPAPMTASILEEPAVLAIAAKHHATPATVILRWLYQLNIPTNPRSMNVTHMKENLSVEKLPWSLDASDMQTLSTMPQNYCKDDKWYECAP